MLDCEGRHIRRYAYANAEELHFYQTKIRNILVWRRGSQTIVAEAMQHQRQLASGEAQQQASGAQLVKSSANEQCKLLNGTAAALRDTSDKGQMVAKLKRFEESKCNQTLACSLAPPNIQKMDQLHSSGTICVCVAGETRELNEGGASTSATLDEWDQLLGHLNPFDSIGWTELSLWTKFAQILRAPLLFVTILTVPVVDSEKINNNWCRPLNSLHCFMIPSIVILTTNWSLSDEENGLVDDTQTSRYWFIVSIKILMSLPGLLVALMVYKTTQADEAPKYHALYAYFGFAMSVLWIFWLANEIICLLKTVGIIFSMTDTAIGLGVLAWGNSLGDIVANLSLAEAGYPRMALGASIGAPLLNLLLGFGSSFTIQLRPGQSTPFEYTPTVTLLCSTLTIILITLMLSILIPGNRSRKPLGYVLIAAYIVYFILAVCLECGLLFPYTRN